MTDLNSLFGAATTTGQHLRLLHVEDQKTSGSHGGSSVATTWTTRTLNTVVSNEISGASLSSNQITLPAGKYYFEASAPAYKINGHRIKLYNATDASDISWGLLNTWLM